MDYNNENILCEQLTEYVMNQLNEIDRLRYERHLDSCVSCRQDTLVLRTVWESIPYEIELVDPPGSLKNRVMRGIFSDTPKRTFRPLLKFRNARQTYWFTVISAAMIVAFVIGSIWNYQLTEERQFMVQSQMLQIDQPAVIEKVLPLFTQIDANESSGVACIVKHGNHSELIIYVVNTEYNEGDQAYQVWLHYNSEPMNAGTFQVGKDGMGILTYRMNQAITFDAIGITLEPDSKGNSPRGQKMFSNAEPIIWN